MSNMCPTVTPEIKELHNKIVQTYPEACKRTGFSERMCAEWVGEYNTANNKGLDYVPDMESLVNMVEKNRNKEGKSFLYVPEKVTYRLPGQQPQTYTVIGRHIFNKNGEEVWAEGIDNNKTHRLRVFTNLAVQQGRAVVVEHKGHKYVVNKRNEIMSVSTSKLMQWDDNNGDRREVLRLAQIEFGKKEPTTNNVQGTASESSENNNNSNNTLYIGGHTISDALSKAIATGNWNKDTIDEYNNLIKQIQDEKVDIERGVGERRNFSTGRNQIHEGASRIIGTDERTDAEKRRNPQEQYEVDAAEGREQERRIEAWAKANDLWLNDYEDAEGNKANTLDDLLRSQWEYINIGSEAEVFHYEDGVVLKSINLSHANDNPGILLDRLAMFNMLFPSTAMEVVGFGRDAQGHFRVIVTQPFIAGSELTDEDLNEFHNKYNLQQVDGWFKTKMPNIYVTDLSPSNIIKGNDGKYYIIDADVKYDAEDKSNNPALEKFKMEIDMLSGYYEGGGTQLRDVYPNLSEELDAKLANYFLGDGKLSLDDYRALYRIMHPAPVASSSPSQATMNIDGGYEAGNFGLEVSPQNPNQTQTTQESLKELAKPSSPALESELKAPTSKEKDFYNAFSPAQITARAKMIASMFSDIIDDTIYDRRDAFNEILNDPAASEADKEKAKESLKVYNDPVLARTAAVDFLSYGVIMDMVRKDLATQAEYATDDDIRQKYENTVTFFDQLANEAARWIDEEEGIRKGKNNSYEEEEAEDEYMAEEEDETSDGNEGFVTKERLMNPFTRLSRQVKRVCGGIETGQKDDLGYSRTYSQGFIYSALISYLSNHLENADDFIQVIKPEDYEEGMQDFEGINVTAETYPYGYPQFPALEDMKAKYPWASQVIARLVKDYRQRDEDDATQLRFPSTFGTLASQFYTNFKCAFIPYGRIIVGKTVSGKAYDGVVPLNYDMEESSQLDELRDSYNNGITYSENSIYNTDKTLNLENAGKLSAKLGNLISDVGGMNNLYFAYKDYIEEGYPLDKAFEEKTNDIADTIKAFGINVTDDNVAFLITDTANGGTLKSMLADLKGIADAVAAVDKNTAKEKNYLTDFDDVWRGFFKGRGLVTETKMMQSFYDPSTKKTRYSYSTDNYLQKTMRNIFGSNKTKEERQQYINEHFGKYEWFRDQSAPEGHGWKSMWLEYAYNDDNPRAALPYLNINSVEDRSAKVPTVHDYRSWNASDIYRVIMRSWNTGSDDYAFYLAPIFADSPMSMTIRGPKYTYEQLISGTTYAGGNYAAGGLLRIVDQELKRIDYVTGARRAAAESGEILPITNFEKRGAKFCIFPELNESMFGPDENMTLVEYLNAIKNAYDESENKSAGALDEMLRKAKTEAIEKVLVARYNEFFSGMPVDVQSELIEDTLNDENINKLYQSLWLPYLNMVYANTQIVELVVVDPAFYKNSVDFQKRFKEVYASGRRPNTNSRYGKKSERVALVADEEVTSRSYSNIEAVINKALKARRLKQSEADYILSCYTFLKGRNGGINVSDAQALRSLTSYRSILDMYGMWNDSLEESFQRITNGEWTMEDYEAVFQTLKPFVYSVIEKDAGVNGEKIAVPVQHKNSELVMLAMYDLISGGLRNSEKMKGINKFLEETKDADGNPIADMIQFESAGKSGNQGVVNINYSHSKVMDTVESESIELVGNNGIIEHEIFLDGKKFADNTRANSADNFDEIKTQLTEKLIAKEITQDVFNRVMKYFQPTAEEVQKTLEDYLTVKDENGVVTGINPEVIQEVPYDDYMIVQPTPQHHMDATAPQGSQGRNIIPADLPEDFELTLDGKDKSTSNMKKEELIDFYYRLNTENLLQNYEELNRIFKDNRTLRDTVMDLALSNPTYGRDFAEAFSLDSDGNFVMSPNSPTIFRKVQQLVNSVIKKKIAVQKVDGAALIQASGVGLSEDLNLVFDENGKLTGAECYLPATSSKFYKALMQEVTINGKKVKVFDPNLLEKAGLDKAIGYRIPTENKSSMLPIIIKGFAPQQNGSSIFLPAEITTLSGSDFDVDKMFVMLSSLDISEYNMKEAREDFAKTNAMFKDILDGFVKAGNIQELDENEIDDIDNAAFKQWFADNQEKYRRAVPKIIKYEYDFSKSPKENGRKARNTMLVQIMYKILTSQEGSEAMFNPQNFEGVVEASKMMRILSTPSLLEAYMNENGLNQDNVMEHLLNASKDDVVKFVKNHDVDRSPVYPQTFEYFHNQNMTGDALLAMFALQVSATAKFQRANIDIKPEQQFTINGRTIQDVDKIMNGLGEHRLKNVSQFVGACADNGKDPNLSDYGATRNNAKVIAYLLRAGLSIKEAALIVNQPLMTDNKTRRKLAGNKNKWKDYPVTSEDLMLTIAGEAPTKAIAILCSKVIEQAKALAELTSMSRADSPNGGLPETFAKARVYKHRIDKFNGNMNSKDFPFFPIQEALNNHSVDPKAGEDVLRERINSSRMSMLQGFYSLGIQSFDTLLSPFFDILDKKFDDLVTLPILINMDYNMPVTSQEELLTALYDDYITFALSAMPMLGNEDSATMKEKREYYTKQFPKDYVKILAENPDIREAIGNIIVNVNGRLVHPNSAQLEKGQRDEIMRRITGLRYLDNPVAQQLVKDLFAYSYYDNGLQHSALGFSTLFSTQYMGAIDGYNDAIKDIAKNIDGDIAERFMTQFVNNHPNMAFDASDKVETSDVVTPNNIVVDRIRNRAFDNPFYSGVYPYRYVSVDGELYILHSCDRTKITYQKMPRFGQGGRIYDLTKDITQMATDYPYMKPAESDPFDPFAGFGFDDVDFGYGVYSPEQDEGYIGQDDEALESQENDGTPADIYDKEGRGQVNNMC